jgi:hypothetical protein
MQEKVDVRVDQAGQERCVAEVDNLRSGRMLYGRANLYDALAPDRHFAGSDDLSGVDLKKSRRV